MIDDIRFRFVDTAGLRETDDRLEQMGIERTEKAVKEADIIIYMVEPSQEEFEMPELQPHQKLLKVVNKMDTTDVRTIADAIYISARYNDVDELRDALCGMVDYDGVYQGDVVVSNMRHAEALSRARHYIAKSKSSLTQNLSGELLAEDLRGAIDTIAEITGRITNDEVLGRIFSRFCIGK